MLNQKNNNVWSLKELQQTSPETVRRVKSGVATTVTEQAQRDGYDVTLYAVRQWAATGAIKVVQAGRKKLINYQSLLDHLEGTTERAWQ